MIRGEIRHPGPQLPPAEPAAEQGEAAFGALSRIGLWGGAAAACLLAVALATRTESGQTRLASAFGTTGPAQVAPGRTSHDAEVEARRMTDTIRSLTEDRDRLLARMTALERNYEDVTGSIGKLARTVRPAVEPAPVPQAPLPATDAEPVASIPASVPVVAGVPAAEPQPVPAPKPAAVAPQKPAAPATALSESPEPVPVRTEFGVDVGGGPSLAAMRTAWERIRRNHASQLAGLRPVIAVRDRTGGQIELRLIVGPIPNAAAAARLCASLAGAGLSCQPTMFEGQRLALN